MISPDHVKLFAAYNGWMNRKVYETAARLTDAQRKEDRGAFFGSIQRTLDHVLYGDRVWLGRFVGRDFGGTTIDGRQHEDFAELLNARRAMDDEINAFGETVSADWLASDFTWVSGIDGKQRTQPAWSLVNQMFNHQTHHRGQVTTLLSQLGEDVGPTDIQAMPYWE